MLPERSASAMVHVACGALVAGVSGMEVLLPAQRRPVIKLTFHVWMALAKASPMDGGDTSRSGLHVTCVGPLYTLLLALFECTKPFPVKAFAK